MTSWHDIAKVTHYMNKYLDLEYSEYLDYFPKIYVSTLFAGTESVTVILNSPLVMNTHPD